MSNYKGPDILRLLILIPLLFVAACVSTTPEADKKSARQSAQTNTTLGQNYMDRGQYEIALEKLKKALSTFVNFDKDFFA